MNTTHAYLIANTPLSTLAFSGAVTTSSIYLNGPGGRSGDGFVLPRCGYLTGFCVWDGATLRSDHAEVAFNAGDRISVYCQSSGSDFAVKIRVNGSSTAIQVSSVPLNCNLYVTVEFMLIRE